MSKSNKYPTVESILDIKDLVSDYDVILFDMDDTMYSEKDHAGCGFRALAEYLNDDSVYDELWDAYISKKPYIDHVLRSRGIFSEERYSEWLNVYRGIIPEISPYDGVIEMLEGFIASGKRLGMITDGRVEAQSKKLDSLGIRYLFEKIILTDSLGGVFFRKPNTTAFEIMQKHYGVPFEKMVYIGDNLKKDGIAPLALGMGFIHFDNKDGIYR